MICLRYLATYVIIVQVYIEGNIAAGKSTLLKHLESAHGQTVEVVYEPVEMWRNLAGHNLLGNFYDDAQKNGFTLQVHQETTHIHYFEKSFVFAKKEANCYLSTHPLVIYPTHLSRVCAFEVHSTNSPRGALDILLLQLLRNKSLPHKGKMFQPLCNSLHTSCAVPKKQNIIVVIY